jgi:hypothetical protein
MSEREKEFLLAQGTPWKAMSPRGGNDQSRMGRNATWRSSATAEAKAGTQDRRNGWIIVMGFCKHTFIPAFLFMAVSILFMVGYHQNPRLLLALAAFFVVVFLSDTLFQYNSKSKLSKDMVMSGISAFAILGGAMVGTSLHLTELHEYWPYYQKRHYTNVAPDELASAHADASVIVFMEGARPDGGRYAGYRRYGSTYCVAPIAVDPGYMDGEETVSAAVQYWAIGKDCCGGQKGFACDDSQNEQARSGLVMTKYTDDDLLMAGILSNDDMAYYENAVQMSMSKFDITSPTERMYVRYVKDIDKARMTYWWAAWWSWWKIQLIWLPGWMFAGAMAMVVATGDPTDERRYNEHIVDFKQSVLFKLNNYI